MILPCKEQMERVRAEVVREYLRDIGAKEEGL